jgi:poly(A) polymerase
LTRTAILADRGWLGAPETIRLMNVLDAARLDFRFVGGAVRDTLLGRAVTDIDVATPAPPESVVSAIDAAGLKAVPTGIEHGTVTAIVAGRPFEITTLRRDVETDGRHAVVAFTEDWREDAARRDFTMNALYADRAGAITDFFGGVADARAGQVRFIGDPAKRIAEDGLRILRFFRFHAHYGKGAPDPAGLAACRGAAKAIDRLSGERVRTELLKLLAAPAPETAWGAMDEAGIAAHAARGATRRADLTRLCAAEARLGLAADPLRRLAALIGPVAESEIVAMKRRLKLSNRDHQRLLALTRPLARAASVAHGPRSFARALHGGDPESIRDELLLEHVRSGRPDIATLADFSTFASRWRDPKFPVTGRDARQAGIPFGPEVGAMLSALERWWVEADFVPNRADCLAELRRRIAPSPTP